MTGSAKQSIPTQGRVDCFVAEFIIGPAGGGTRWLLAMTVESSRSLRPQRCDNRIQPIRQRRWPRLQYQRRFYLDDAVIAHCRDVAPARPLSDFVRNDLLAAPGCEDHVRRCGAHHFRQNNAVLGGLLKPQFWQHVFAARDLDQLRNPADAADQGIVPFLEIDFWFCRGSGSRGDASETLLIAGGKPIGVLRGADQRRRACGSSPGCQRYCAD
jgi:hypothetical protein